MDEAYLGEIRLFGGGYAPEGWALCNGQSLSITNNVELFNLIGTTYGGDGETNFNLPDLRGRVPIHVSSTHPLSMIGGSEQVTLTQNNLPAHSHAVVSAPTGGSDSPANNSWGPVETSGVYASATSTTVPMSSAGISSSGGSINGTQPHENMIPFLCITYIIALSGIIPNQ